MEYWTVMVITVLSGYMEETKLMIPYETEAQCVAALNPVSDTLPYDHKLECVVSDKPSASIRPMPRPDDLEG